MLELVNLEQTYFYGAKAINNLSLKINDGEKVAVLSKSGGGKTSLLKCIAGLFPATNGKILLDGKDITNLKPKDRDVRVVYDDGGLIRKRTVKYNLEYPLKIRKVEKDERLILAYNSLKEYGLEPFYKEYAFRLFEGEIIALALARLSLRDCPLTMIDNLFALTNGQERKDLFRKFLPKLRDIGGNVIFATDSLEEAFSFGDRVIVLEAGNLQQFDTPKGLMENPQTLCVEKLVNPHKTVLISGVVDGIVEIDNLKIKIDNYDKNEIILSYSLKIDSNGQEFSSAYKEYVGAGLYNFVNVAGDTILSRELPQNLKVSIDTNSLRLYDRVNEKLLTYEIL